MGMTREEEIKARLEKASKGPWYAMNTDDRSFMNIDFVVNKPMTGGGLIENFDPKDIIAITLLQDPRYASNERFEENQDLIVNAPMDIEYLLASNEGLQRQVEKYETLAETVAAFLDLQHNMAPYGHLIDEMYKDIAALDALDAKEQDDASNDS